MLEHQHLIDLFDDDRNQAISLRDGICRGLVMSIVGMINECQFNNYMEPFILQYLEEQYKNKCSKDREKLSKDDILTRINKARINFISYYECSNESFSECSKNIEKRILRRILNRVNKTKIKCIIQGREKFLQYKKLKRENPNSNIQLHTLDSDIELHPLDRVNINILGFRDTSKMFFTPHSYEDLFYKKNLRQRNIEYVAKCIGSRAFKKVYTNCDIYNEPELEHFFITVSLCIECGGLKYKKEIIEDISLTIGSGEHAINVRYSLKEDKEKDKRKYHLIDPNKLWKRNDPYNEETIASEVLLSLKNDNFSNIATDIFIHHDYYDKYKHQFTYFNRINGCQAYYLMLTDMAPKLSTIKQKHFDKLPMLVQHGGDGELFCIFDRDDEGEIIKTIVKKQKQQHAVCMATFRDNQHFIKQKNVPVKIDTYAMLQSIKELMKSSRAYILQHWESMSSHEKRQAVRKEIIEEQPLYLMVTDNKPKLSTVNNKQLPMLVKCGDTLSCNYYLFTQSNKGDITQTQIEKQQHDKCDSIFLHNQFAISKVKNNISVKIECNAVLDNLITTFKPCRYQVHSDWQAISNRRNYRKHPISFMYADQCLYTALITILNHNNELVNTKELVNVKETRNKIFLPNFGAVLQLYPARLACLRRD